jgi:hypothetical protein
MGRLRYGVHKELEAEADALLRQSLQGVTSHSAKSDILTPWKEVDRRRREVYVATGIPDPSVRQGMFNRSLNPTRPHLNSRDGGAIPANTQVLAAQRDRSTLADFVAAHCEGSG